MVKCRVLELRLDGVSRLSFNDTKEKLKRVCELCNVNSSKMLKYSGCNCTYYCSAKCQKEDMYKYHKYACKNLKNDGGFDRDTHNNIKYGLNLNINSNTFKNSIVNTSGCKYWKINFDPDDIDDTYMILTQSSKEQYIDECDARTVDKVDSDACFIFYYTINTGSESKLYAMAILPV